MICLDIDGVIAHPYDEVNKRIAGWGINVVPYENWTHYDVTRFYPAEYKKDIKQLFRDPMVTKNAIPYADAWYWINHIHYTTGEDIVLVTHRIKKFLEIPTWNWVMDWELPIADIHFVNGDKTKVLHDLEECRFFVEDHAGNANSAAEAGIETYLINRVYNKLEDCSAKRIDSLWEIEYGTNEEV